MTDARFKGALAADAPTPGWPVALAALWHAARGGWDTAHKLVMDEPGADCAWVHAHLHRIEGDLDNAGYWYRQAGRPRAEGSIEAEAQVIAAALTKE